MNVLLPLAVDEALDPLTLVDPTLADRWFRKRPTPESMTGAEPPVPAMLNEPVRMAGVTELLAAYANGNLTPSHAIEELKTAMASSHAGSEAILRLVSGLQASVEESDRRWHSGTPRPLEGIPFGVKDIIDVADTVTTAGSHFTGNRVAPADADVVARLRAAGAIPFAMTATTEFACGSPHNPRFGAITNPWNATRWTGGSSTGSGAALAARLMPFALGTDTGGSIRVPSCWCGTTGLKPSRELVSRQGVSPLSWTLDHIGPMTRSARDIAAVLPFMTAAQDGDLQSACRNVLKGVKIEGMRIGVPVNWFTETVDDGVLGNWRAGLGVLESLGCKMIPLPHIDVEPLHEAGWVVLLSELAALHSERLDRADLFDRGMLARLKQGMDYSAADYGKALQNRKRAQDLFLSAMDDIDLLVTPGIGGEAGMLDTLTVDVNGQHIGFQNIISRNTMIFDFTGFPALMIPSGLGRTGLPTGIQIVGRPGADALCLTAGAAFQSATRHHRIAPDGIPQ